MWAEGKRTILSFSRSSILKLTHNFLVINLLLEPDIETRKRIPVCQSLLIYVGIDS